MKTFFRIYFKTRSSALQKKELITEPQVNYIMKFVMGWLAA
jgi:hypothetical protein